MTPIIKWEPLMEPFQDLEKLLDGSLAKGFVPLIDVYETKTNVVVETPLPGIDPEKVDIAINNDVLQIKGTTAKHSEVEDKDYYHKEIRSGSFYRSVVLPAHVLAAKASAVFADGILKITVPKLASKATKTFKVKINKAKK
ncbi:MAG: hypothetical protein A2744_03015 [Candidatus Buchananbacteria bacterium RIFCSPHIGHO2_01_FULL_44_11]|uniref:SHSP domain-containing protein n=1 Tax=Candidatus Buchananbacteria bacterium RIFCSPHIGHO2_01_FULL_44_11 TaxID=1797535 RepID=A0A1G1Y031_9BACT|nr:MAG: hypothetical protein A2744_03015 [Candidatus Buchananbacteria bacterium RIFCSPHIGHO2_01_FULL_44_11]